jgi:LysR family hydrogen peroxide-inducible transcriptional activator
VRALVTLAEHRHFGQAAEALGISQPSLSAAIQKVETGLRVRIFERTSRRCELTGEGQLIVHQAQLVIDEATRLVELAEGREAPLTGQFRLGIIPTVAPYYLPHVFELLLSAYPKLQLVLREEVSDQLVSLMRKGAIDAALLSLPLNDDALLEFPLLQEELALAVPEDHPLADEDKVGVEALEAGKMILLEHGHCLREQTLELCGTSMRNASVHATSLETLRFMVRAGLGYAVVPAMAVHWDGRTVDGVKYLRFQHPAPSRTLGLVTLRSGHRLDDVQTLRDFLRGVNVTQARL